MNVWKETRMWNIILNSGFITVSVHTMCAYIGYRFLLLFLWLVQGILRFTSQDATFGGIFTPTFAKIQHVILSLHPLFHLPAFLWRNLGYAYCALLTYVSCALWQYSIRWINGTVCQCTVWLQFRIIRESWYRNICIDTVITSRKK